jgi:4-amino-4-deoxy-L-arabinose transferase-like glycosyltransferase
VSRRPSRKRGIVLGVALALLAASLLLRAVYFREIEDGPLLLQHLWGETDMSFFHAWARRIAEGDWLGEESLHPVHAFHRRVARDAFQALGMEGPFDQETARRLWDGWFGGRRFHQEPLYPYLLALSYRLLGPEVSWIFLGQLLLGALANLLVFELTRRHFGLRAGVLAGIAALLYGPFLFYETVLLRTTALRVSLLLSVLVLDRALARSPRPRPRELLGVGIVLGIATLLKSTALLLALLAGFWILARGRDLRSLAATACLTAGVFLPLLPLAARNIHVGVSPFALSSVAAQTLMMGNEAEIPPGSGALLSSRSGPIMARAQGRLWPTILAVARTHPNAWSILRRLGRKLLLFWTAKEIPNNISYEYYRRYYPLLGKLPLGFGLIGACAFAGLILAARRLPQHAALYLALTAEILTAVLFLNLSRLRLPAVGLLIPFAAHAVLALTAAFRRADLRAAGGILLLLAGGAALTHVPAPHAREIRTSDYLVGNEMTGRAARQQLERGDPHAATEELERALTLEPPAVRSIKGDYESIGPNVDLFNLAKSFAQLHQLAGEIQRRLGRPVAALRHLADYRRLRGYVDTFSDPARWEGIPLSEM